MAAHGRRKAPIASKSVRYDIRSSILFSPPGHGLVAMRYSSEAIDMQYISGIVREEDSRSTGQSEKCVGRYDSESDEMRMITASFMRALQRCTGSLSMYFHLIFQ